MLLENNIALSDTYLDSAQRLLLLLPRAGSVPCCKLAETLCISEAEIDELLRVLVLHSFPLVVRDRRVALTFYDFSPLSPVQIAAQLGSSANITRIECFAYISSTNDYLMSSARNDLCIKSGTVCLTELQTAGRGRRGKKWSSPAGKNLYLSAYWHLPLRREGVAGFSLALGVAVADALEQVGLLDIQLKWPNDIFWQGQKLGGILVDASVTAHGYMHVVVGLGLNVKFISHTGSDIDQPWTDLETALGRAVDRCQLVAQLLTAISHAVMAYWHHGLTPFHAQWTARDALAGKPILATSPERTLLGVARGLDDIGALLLDTGDAVIRLFTEEVSIRIISNAETSAL